MHVREPALDSVLVKRQFLVIETEQVQRGRVEIVAVGRIHRGLPSTIVACAVADPTLDAAPREPRW